MVIPTLPFLHIHEPKENNRGAAASSLSMGTCGSTAMNTHGGFTPAAVAPPNAKIPEQVIRHHRYKRKGRKGGQALCPPSLYQCFVFHMLMKGITMKDTQLFIMFA